MSPLTEPTRLVLRRTWQPMDPDAAAYITAVEAADTAAGSPGRLEERTKIAIDNFVLGCKADGIWTAIKASCILAGARTLSGALVPLVGAAPTPFNFLPADYNRKTGLVGDGSTKHLNANRNSNIDPRNSFHMSCFRQSGTMSGTQIIMGDDGGSVDGSNVLLIFTSLFYFRNRTGSAASVAFNPINFIGTNRSSSNSYAMRINSSLFTYNTPSQSPRNSGIAMFASPNGLGYSNARLAFYSIGESLDLALLDVRVTDLINAFATAIP